MFNSPTSFFVGNLNAKDKAFEKSFFTEAKKAGITKFIEPCSGEMAMSQIAIEVGFKDIEASDVTLFSTLLGYYVMGRDAAPLCVDIEGIGRCDEIAEILYWQLLFKLKKNEGAIFYDNLIRDVEGKKAYHKGKITETLDKAKEKFGGKVIYFPKDMSKHVKEVYDDPNALVVMNFPTYKGGYEKNFDVGGKITWKEPDYEMFDPKSGKMEMKQKLQGAKCLVLFYEEAYPKEAVFDPLYVRFGARNGMNTYITTNDIERAKQIMDKKFAVWLSEKKMTKLDCSMVRGDYEFTEKTRIRVEKVGADVCNYYRTLLTHNFNGVSSSSGFAVFVDDMVLGVFGYEKAFSAFFGNGENKELFVMFGMAKPVNGYRTNRLMIMLEKLKVIAWQELNDLERFSYKEVKTTMISKYPESKQMRGLMKRTGKAYDEKSGMYKIEYKAEMQRDTIEETYLKWLKKEKEYRELKK